MRRLLWAVACCCATAPLAAQDTHLHHMHSHRGAGPHFIDAFFTENAYLERKIRPDVFTSHGDGGTVSGAQIEVEWALLRNVAAIIHAPVLHLAPTGGSTETGLGDASIGLKVAPINDRSRLIVAFGSDLDLPTGNQSRGLGEGHAVAAPFALAWVPFGPEKRFLLQAGFHAEVPLVSGAEKHGEAGLVLSWTSPQGISPIVEGIAHIPLDGGATSWSVAPEVRWEFREGWETGAGVKLPVSGPRENDYQVIVGLIHHFALPFADE